jgi:pimeloyl-ACP methyl ester carboxylesterase
MANKPGSNWLAGAIMACLLLSCASKENWADRADLETVEKNAEFRATIKTGDFVKLSAGYTYYEFENREADTLLVMVHGFSVPAYIWDSTYYAALSRGFGALRYDVYGRGYSDNPDVVYDVALYASQLRELLDALHIEEKINLLGLSYGGRTISAFAYQYPERVKNLIYVDPAGFETIAEAGNYPAMVSDEEIEAFKQSEGYATMASGQLGDFYDSVPFKGWDKKYEQMMQFKGFTRALISTRKNSQSLEMEQRKIAESGIPVFAIWGEHDTVVKLDEVRDNLMSRIPKVELFVLPKAGHLPHMEQTTMFNSILFDQIICCEH